MVDISLRGLLLKVSVVDANSARKKYTDEAVLASGISVVTLGSTGTPQVCAPSKCIHTWRPNAEHVKER